MAPDQLKRNVPSFHLKCSYHRKIELLGSQILEEWLQVANQS
jgi:hypothetical protein